MEQNKQLSIVIPTYNRAEFLDYSLEVHIPMVREFNIEIAIFDNASTDNTGEIVTKWMKEYAFLSYHRSETNIGPDANFKRALKHPDTDYIWLLSDTYQMPNSGIDYFFNIVNSTTKDYDVIVFNLADKIKIPTKNYQNQNELLNDLGAVMTCAAINIYNKNLINRAKFSRYYNSYFVQTGIIFEYIANSEFLIHWVQTISVVGLEHPTLKKRNWSYTPKVFEIGCEKWTNFVMSLPPSYILDIKMKCIIDFGKVSGLFTFRNLLTLRSKNLLNIKVFNQYKKLFPLTVDYPLWVVFVISIVPSFIFDGLIKVYKMIRKR